MSPPRPATTSSDRLPVSVDRPRPPPHGSPPSLDAHVPLQTPVRPSAFASPLPFFSSADTALVHLAPVQSARLRPISALRSSTPCPVPRALQARPGPHTLLLDDCVGHAVAPLAAPGRALPRAAAAATVLRRCRQHHCSPRARPLVRGRARSRSAPVPLPPSFLSRASAPPCALPRLLAVAALRRATRGAPAGSARYSPVRVPMPGARKAHTR